MEAREVRHVPLETQAKRLLGRTMPKLEGNIEMILKEIGPKGISS
jgi:hypothetical protein